MIIDIARITVQIFGALIAVLSLWGMVVPQRLLALVGKVATNPSGIFVAVGVRLLLGAALLLAAETAGFPTTFMILGGVAIAAAVGLLIVGSGRMRKLVEWVTRWPESLVRAWLVFGLGFGAFLIIGA